MAEISNDLDALIQRIFHQFESPWSKLVDLLAEGKLLEIMNEHGIKVNSTSTRRKGSYGGESFEFAIIAHNGEEIVVVEVKTTLRIKHVNRFIERLNRVKTWLPEYKNARVYGAVAFQRADEESAIFAERQKLFAIRATGDSAAIVNQPGFVPRAF
jgi:Holliday junction resolvase